MSAFWGRGTEWMRRAACKAYPGHLWFPPQYMRHDHPDVELARRVCARCPVNAECLEYALGHSLEGIWGGTSERERIRIKQGRAASAG